MKVNKYFENINNKDNSVLIELYNNFNNKYFNNKLPTDLEIKWFRSKNSAGVAKAKFIKKRHKLDITEIDGISISNFRPLSKNKLNGLMLHEMIHIYLYTKNVVYTSGRDKVHGYEFLDKLKELQKQANFEIPLTEYSMEISDDIKSKTFDVLFYIDNKIAFSVYSKDYLIKNKDNLIKKWEYTLEQRRKRGENVKMLVYQSNDKYLLNYKCKRNLNTLTFYGMEKDKFNEFIKNAKKLYEF